MKTSPIGISRTLQQLSTLSKQNYTPTINVNESPKFIILLKQVAYRAATRFTNCILKLRELSQLNVLLGIDILIKSSTILAPLWKIAKQDWFWKWNQEGSVGTAQIQISRKPQNNTMSKRISSLRCRSTSAGWNGFQISNRKYKLRKPCRSRPVDKTDTNYR